MVNQEGAAMTGKRKKTKHDLLMTLACGATVAQAADKAGVSERTVYRRLADPAFRAQLDQLRADMVQRGAGMLTAASLEAIKTVVGLLGSNAPEQVRHGAARTILQYGVRLRELAELQARLAALEGQLGMDAAREAA
jgi:AcrR family transcriptional regulator